MTKKKLIIAVVGLVVLGGAGYTMTKPKKVVKMKIAGTIYTLPQSFLLNLSEGHYAKLSVSLELAPGQSDGARRRAAARPKARGNAAGGTAGARNHHDAVTGQSGSTLVSITGRDSPSSEQILTTIDKDTDLKVEKRAYSRTDRAIGGR